jgi:ubiquinone/menaquinone biosynthesis C-methylase UbiE
MRGRMEKKLNDGGLDQRVTAELTVVCAALPNLSFSDEYIDAVVTWFVTSHLPRGPESMKEVFRVLRPGGVLAVLYHGAHATGTTTTVAAIVAEKSRTMGRTQMVTDTTLAAMTTEQSRIVLLRKRRTLSCHGFGN